MYKIWQSPPLDVLPLSGTSSVIVVARYLGLWEEWNWKRHGMWKHQLWVWLGRLMLRNWTLLTLLSDSVWHSFAIFVFWVNNRVGGHELLHLIQDSDCIQFLTPFPSSSHHRHNHKRVVFCSWLTVSLVYHGHYILEQCCLWCVCRRVYRYRYTAFGY